MLARLVRRGNDFLLHFSQLFIRRLVARPEEAAQAVAALAGNDVNVKMWHALADDVVQRHKCAVRLHRALHRLSQGARVREYGPDQILRKIVES